MMVGQARSFLLSLRIVFFESFFVVLYNVLGAFDILFAMVENDIL